MFVHYISTVYINVQSGMYIYVHLYIYVCGILFNIIIVTQLSIATRIYPGLYYINNAGN